MIKILAVIGGAAVLAGAIVLLPGMTPIDPAASQLGYGKVDHVDSRSYGYACSERGWPYYEPNCMHTSQTSEAKPVRIVALDRLSTEMRSR